MIALALAYLKQRKLATTLNVLLVALAVALLTLLLLVSVQSAQRLERTAAGVDLVVGAKGSPLQLILSSVFHVDQPTGNIPVQSLAMLRQDPAVARATPVALGDNFRGFRIVGTDDSFLALKNAAIAEGGMFASVGEVVIGADVARKTGAELGQRFIGSHGLGDGGHDHEHRPFTVVGILERTGDVTDRLILTSVESVWDAHGIHHDLEYSHSDEHDVLRDHGPHEHVHHDQEGHAHGDQHDHATESPIPERPALHARGELQPELTAILVSYANASAAVRIPSMINRQTALQSAVPAVETGRLLALFGASVAALQVFGWTLAGIAGLAIFATLFAATQGRSGDLALLRVMGASRREVTVTVLAEGLLVAFAGVLLGVVAGHLLLWIGVARFETLADLGFDPLQPQIGVLLIGVATLLIAAVAALIPATRVYRSNIVRTLAEAS